MSGDPLPPDYDSIERKAWLENAEEVPKRLSSNDKDLLKRVRTYIDRFRYPESNVKDKIQHDPMFAAHFAKEPRRQSLHERVAADWICNLNAVKEFESLPKSGREALYITSDGEVMRGNEIRSRPSKSLDFKWKTGATTCYAMHKYTREGGGNQDSQYKEMLALLKLFLNCRDKSLILIVIVDGPYYTEAKMSELTHSTRDHPPKSFAVHIESVPTILRDYEL